MQCYNCCKCCLLLPESLVGTGVMIPSYSSLFPRTALRCITLQALDYVIYTAKRMGIRLHLVLSNMWPDFGGKDQVQRGDSLWWRHTEQHLDVVGWL